MRLKNAFIMIFMGVLCGWSFIPEAPVRAATASEQIAVSLVIDTSGSMAETDPNNLRKKAADIFVDLLSPDDHVGIVSFATDATELVPMQQVGDTANKQAIKTTLASLTEVDGNTNYQTALEKAEQQLDSFSDEHVRKVVIFLTDGVPEPDYALREDAAFMTAYMDSVWQTTARLGLKNIAVYPLGFGTVDTSILQRIATDTRGEAKFLGNAGEIAVNFFEVLRTLKNRQGFWNETIALSGETVVPLQIDGYTSQVTMAVASDTLGTDVWIRSVDGADGGDRISTQKNEQYSILTMNQTEDELAGDWELVITGTGSVQLFGDKDLTLKSWMTSPQANTQVPIHEPLELAVEVTGAESGELDEGMRVQVIVSKNGEEDFDTIPLKWQDGQYVGTYDEVDQAGTYILETQISDGDTNITSSSISVSVQQLPVLKSDQKFSGEIFKIGESQAVSGHLELDDQLLDASQGITVNSMNLVIDYSDGRQEIIPMQDSGPETSADATAGDGQYTALLPIAAEGSYNAEMVVQGTTPGGNFTLQKAVGDYRVASAGSVAGTVMEDELYTKPGSKITIPVQLRNESERSETVRLLVESEDVAGDEVSLVLEAGETVVTDFELSVADTVALGSQKIALQLLVEDPLTQVQASIDTEVQLLSGSAYNQKKMQDFLAKNGLFAAVVASFPLVAIAFGRAVYAFKLKRALNISRSLMYTSANHPEIKQEWLLPKKAGKQEIAFGISDAKAALSLEGAKIPYRMIVTIETAPARIKWLEGYRALSKTYLPVHITVETTPPGIIKMDGEIYTSKEIFDQDSFESSGYLFLYKADKPLAEETKARNILEGKM